LELDLGAHLVFSLGDIPASKASRQLARASPTQKHSSKIMSLFFVHPVLLLLLLMMILLGT